MKNTKINLLDMCEDYTSRSVLFVKPFLILLLAFVFDPVTIILLIFTYSSSGMILMSFYVDKPIVGSMYAVASMVGLTIGLNFFGFV